MCALDPVPSPSPADRLAELIVSAVTALVPSPAAAGPVPTGVPVRRGRLHLGALRSCLPADAPVSVTVGFATVCWLGPPDGRPPDLGRLTHRAESMVDARGRVVLDRRVRAWLSVADQASFEVITMRWPSGGVLVIPVEGFARRFEAVIP